LYRAHDQGDIVFRREIDDLAAHHGVRIAYLLTQAGSRPATRGSWFEPQALKRLVPDIAERVAYVCGPPGMMSVVIRSLHALGVPPDQIRTEDFRLI